MAHSFQDAVTFLKTEARACYGWGVPKEATHSISLHENMAEEFSGLEKVVEEDTPRQRSAASQRRFISPNWSESNSRAVCSHLLFLL